jgi:electron transfer flavoprotein alpha subunit
MVVKSAASREGWGGVLSSDNDSLLFIKILTRPLVKECTMLETTDEIWVIAIARDSEPHPATLELLAEAVTLAQKAGLVVAAVTLGAATRFDLCDALARAGSGHVYSIEHALLEDWTAATAVAALQPALAQRRPRLVLCPGTPVGAELAALLAAALGAPLAVNCLRLQYDSDGSFLAIHAAYRDRAYALVRYQPAPGQSLVATYRPGFRGGPPVGASSVRANLTGAPPSDDARPHNAHLDESHQPERTMAERAGLEGPVPGAPALTESNSATRMSAEGPLGPRAGQRISRLPYGNERSERPQPAMGPGESDATVISVTIAPETARVRRLAAAPPDPETVSLEDAERIIAGGRGIGQEGFALLAEVAHVLGAAIGATRVATDRGWVSHERQIGATGRTVHPRLYIACGISGAAQHTSGMKDADIVVAINPDRTAPIFALANLGLLGDANAVLREALQLLKEESHAAKR